MASCQKKRNGLLSSYNPERLPLRIGQTDVSAGLYVGVLMLKDLWSHATSLLHLFLVHSSFAKEGTQSIYLRAPIDRERETKKREKNHLEKNFLFYAVVSESLSIGSISEVIREVGDSCPFLPPMVNLTEPPGLIPGHPDNRPL